MGRPKEASKLRLVDLVDTPLPAAAEFMMLHGPLFSVPFNHIKVKETKETPIPGLWTPEEAVKEKFLSQKNVFSVKVLFENDEFPDTCYVLNGRTTVDELSAKIYFSFQLDAFAELEFFSDQNALFPDTLLYTVYKESMSSDGYVHIRCRIVDGDNE